MTDIPTIDNYTKEAIEKAFSSVSEQMWNDALGTTDEPSIEAFRVRWLGRKTGILTRIRDEWMAKTPPELKKLFGMHYNGLREEIEDQIKVHTAIALGADIVP